MKGKRQGMPLGWIWLLVTLGIVFTAVLVYNYRVYRVTAAFRLQDHGEVPDIWEQSAMRRFLSDTGVDLTVPATGGEALTFTSPKKFEITRYGQRYTIHQGDQLCCDFISWSGTRSSDRYLRFSWEDREWEVSVPSKLAAQLYAAALEQNGLADQFQRETGEALTRRSAREALRAIDRQIYGLGIYPPRDYPFDRDFWKSLTLLVGGSAPLVLLVLLTVLPELAEYQRYQRWLAEYNRDSGVRWERISGELPQFVSLRESGGTGKPRFAYSGYGPLGWLKRLFSTPAKR